MELAGKKALIVGLGRTGEATAGFLLRRGAKVRISEKKTASELGRAFSAWIERGAKVEAGGHVLSSFLKTDVIIPSPGVPPIPELMAARDRGIPILSEIELAFRYLKGTIVGITGTNGKSTTSTLLYRILKKAGFAAHLAGNIGTPLISFAETSRPGDIYVAEISSFQLEFTDAFRVPLSVFLNISRNHIDWHGSFESYFEAKKKLVTAQKAGDRAILNRDDPLVWNLKDAGEFQTFGFSRKRSVGRGCIVRNGWIVVRGEKDKRIMPVSEIRLPGLHNLENVMAAALAGHLLGAPAIRMRQAIGSFMGLEHRLEHVLNLRGVEFINDSKATTVEASMKALESSTKPIVLILGGRDKGADFTELRSLVKAKVKKIVLVGEAADKIGQALRGTAPMEKAAVFREVVPLAFASASRGDIVLLSPACTSWDMFRNFEERGRLFKREVRKLAATFREKRD
jgi:UDP-N-acetylmuramoylalanine--D-glutamate ligase